MSERNIMVSGTFLSALHKLDVIRRYSQFNLHEPRTVILVKLIICFELKRQHCDIQVPIFWNIAINFDELDDQSNGYWHGVKLENWGLNRSRWLHYCQVPWIAFKLTGCADEIRKHSTDWLIALFSFGRIVMRKEQLDWRSTHQALISSANNRADSWIWNRAMGQAPQTHSPQQIHQTRSQNLRAKQL